MRLLLIAMIAGLICVIAVGVILFTSGKKGLKGDGTVAVLKVQDVILDSQIYLDSLKKIKKASHIKALVVRIDSPGGAVGPSQEIYGEIKRLRAQMPVVASIGGIGASGGYYIACAAESIYANPGAITGSIGVIAQFANYGKLLEWAKVDVEIIKSGKYKDAGTPFRKMSDPDRQYIQELINNVYEQFKNTVAVERKLNPKQISQIADGRVFTGEQAKALKLIDELGTINDAISAAGNLAGIQGEPETVYYPKRKREFLDFLLSKVGLGALSDIPKQASFGLFYLADIIN